jgi:hypothetical protein
LLGRVALRYALVVGRARKDGSPEHPRQPHGRRFILQARPPRHGSFAHRRKGRLEDGDPFGDLGRTADRSGSGVNAVVLGPDRDRSVETIAELNLSATVQHQPVPADGVPRKLGVDSGAVHVACRDRVERERRIVRIGGRSGTLRSVLRTKQVILGMRRDEGNDLLPRSAGRAAQRAFARTWEGRRSRRRQEEPARVRSSALPPRTCALMRPDVGRLLRMALGVASGRVFDRQVEFDARA